MSKQIIDVETNLSPVESMGNNKSEAYISSQGRKIAWPAAIFIVAVHIAALAGFWTFTWPAFFLFLFMHWLTGGVGITLGFHRLLTHRSFRTPKWVEYILAVIGTLACQGGPIKWVVAHRIHHAFSDEEGDPHTPVQNFMWAHMYWCMHKNELIDDPKNYPRFAPDLTNDKVMQFIDKTLILWTIALAGIFYALGGWPFVVWGIFVRLVAVYHTTWFVNSATHVWGYQTYRSKDKSTNLWWVALLSYGEGWHNNHHAFQTSARHGLAWWEFDTTYTMIRLMRWLGLATDVKIPSKHLLETKRIKAA